VKKEFLAPSITGDKVACLGVSEAGAGSDVASKICLYFLYFIPEQIMAFIVMHLVACPPVRNSLSALYLFE
jgi:hypothetical protein